MLEPDQPVDPAKDKRIVSGFYGIAPSPADGSIWGSSLGFPGAIVRLSLGSNPPETTLAEIYQPPYDNPEADVEGYGPPSSSVIPLPKLMVGILSEISFRFGKTYG